MDNLIFMIILLSFSVVILGLLILCTCGGLGENIGSAIEKKCEQLDNYIKKSDEEYENFVHLSKKKI
jgi:hypothetical protein